MVRVGWNGVKLDCKELYCRLWADVYTAIGCENSYLDYPQFIFAYDIHCAIECRCHEGHSLLTVKPLHTGICCCWWFLAKREEFSEFNALIVLIS